MTIDILNELNKDVFRERLTKYTRKAFRMLPNMDEPRILDIGCGTGVPTIELARLSNGQVIGLDIDQPSLDKLNKKIKGAGLSGQVKTVKCSMFEMDFPDESFDIIWAEGAIARIGFERGLIEWRRFLKANRFLVVHDEINSIKRKLEQIPECGYNLLGHFTIPDNAWWNEYYGPLERRINELRLKYRDDANVLVLLNEEQKEIDRFKKNPELYRSAFFLMQKK